MTRFVRITSTKDRCVGGDLKTNCFTVYFLIIIIIYVSFSF